MKDIQVYFAFHLHCIVSVLNAVVPAQVEKKVCLSAVPWKDLDQE